MKRWLWDNGFHTSKLLCCFCALLLLTVPIRWLLATFTGVLIHELCHITAVYLCGKKITQIQIGVSGAQILTGALTGWQEFVCLAAGPIGSLSLICFFPWLPLTAFMGCVQGLFNLLPVFPLDGGRMVFCLLRAVFDIHMAQKIMNGIEICVFAALSGLCILVCFVLRMGIFPLLILVSLFVQGQSGKIPCKLPQLRVQ